MLTERLPDDPARLRQIIAHQQEALVQQQERLLQQQDAFQQQAEVLRRQTRDLQEQNDRLDEQRKQLERDTMLLEHQLHLLLKRAYGPRADRIDAAQLLLDFADLLESRPVNPADLPCQTSVQTVTRRVRRGRRNLARLEDLEVIQKVIDLPDEQKPCPCCGTVRRRMGEDKRWLLELIPAKLVRIEEIRCKYVCCACEEAAAETGPQIVVAEKPTAPIDKGLAGPGLLAHVATSKFADFLPLYRLEAFFERLGVHIDRATMCVWMRDIAELALPLYQLMVRRVLASHLIATDDTVLPMLAPGKTKKARIWIYRGDDGHPYNVFDFTISRTRDGPARFLKDYHGVLQADAYGGYEGICVGGGIIQAGCWAHGRRKFVDTQSLAPAITGPALALIGQLFDIERAAEGLSPQEHLALRRQKSVPVLDQLHERLIAWKDGLLPKHPVAAAVGYVLNQWGPLTAFTRDPAIRLDNNLAEQQMKRIAMGRKAFLFVGNERGGQTAAILSSLTSTCRRHEIDPQRYLTQLLVNLPSTPLSRLDQWLPDVWKQRQTPARAAAAADPAPTTPTTPA
ncbi:MAG TPA: IS66 family transposase [Phycisphaerae bacterium]|nr:IS66 family transposase [Phycisphaerae bacterium]